MKLNRKKSVRPELVEGFLRAERFSLAVFSCIVKEMGLFYFNELPLLFCHQRLNYEIK